MEFLKDKKLLVGGLAVIGGIALVAYLLKQKTPRRNSEGFFNAVGKGIPDRVPIIQIPSSFVRKGGFPSGCARYERFVTPIGGKYLKRKFIKSDVAGMPDQVSIEIFPITKQEFMMAFQSNAFC
jgi:hypothetical protein